MVGEYLYAAALPFMSGWYCGQCCCRGYYLQYGRKMNTSMRGVHVYECNTSFSSIAAWPKCNELRSLNARVLVEISARSTCNELRSLIVRVLVKNSARPKSNELRSVNARVHVENSARPKCNETPSLMRGFSLKTRRGRNVTNCGP